VPRPLNQDFFRVLARAGVIRVEPLHDKIEGGRADEVEVAVNARGGAHFIGRAVEVGKPDVVGHADVAPGEERARGVFIDEQGIGFVAVEPIAEFRDADILGRQEWLAAIALWEPALPIEKSAGPEIV
jgi:hypothetical protein